MKDVLYLLAGNLVQATDWVRARSITPASVRYVNDQQALRGLRNPSYVILGTFWERPDAFHIWSSLMVATDPEFRMHRSIQVEQHTKDAVSAAVADAVAKTRSAMVKPSPVPKHIHDLPDDLPETPRHGAGQTSQTRRIKKIQVS